VAKAAAGKVAEAKAAAKPDTKSAVKAPVKAVPTAKAATETPALPPENQKMPKEQKAAPAKAKAAATAPKAATGKAPAEKVIPAQEAAEPVKVAAKKAEAKAEPKAKASAKTEAAKPDTKSKAATKGKAAKAEPELTPSAAPAVKQKLVAAKTVPATRPLPAPPPPPAPMTKPEPPLRPELQRSQAPNRPTAQSFVRKPAVAPKGFKKDEHVVYPAHGVGQIVAIEEQEVAGFKLELYVVVFAKDKMTLRVPTGKAATVGMRKLSEAAVITKALETLTGRARIKRTMWSRRAQEYEAKINSGDIIAISEVVRDLHRAETQPEQSYSERQLYEAALDRMVREVAAVNDVTDTEALQLIEGQLAKSPRRGKTVEASAEGETDETDDIENEDEQDEAA
jgi:CarD family transcriptional regulator